MEQEKKKKDTPVWNGVMANVLSSALIFVVSLIWTWAKSQSVAGGIGEWFLEPAQVTRWQYFVVQGLAIVGTVWLFGPLVKLGWRFVRRKIMTWFDNLLESAEHRRKGSTVPLDDQFPQAATPLVSAKDIQKANLIGTIKALSAEEVNEAFRRISVLPSPEFEVLEFVINHDAGTGVTRWTLREAFKDHSRAIEEVVDALKKRNLVRTAPGNMNSNGKRTLWVLATQEGNSFYKKHSR